MNNTSELFYKIPDRYKFVYFIKDKQYFKNEDSLLTELILPDSKEYQNIPIPREKYSALWTGPVFLINGEDLLNLFYSNDVSLFLYYIISEPFLERLKKNKAITVERSGITRVYLIQDKELEQHVSGETFQIFQGLTS